MCLSGDSIKLCTCSDGEELHPPMWTLQRRDQSLSEETRRGRFVAPKWSDTELTERDALLAALQAGGCFDFDYKPELGDVLTVIRDEQALPWRFRVEPSNDTHLEWRTDNSNAFTPWRSQMVSFSSGPIESA